MPTCERIRFVVFSSSRFAQSSEIGIIIKVMVGTVLATGDEVMTLNLYFSQVKNESVQIFEIDQKQNVRDSWKHNHCHIHSLPRRHP